MMDKWNEVWQSTLWHALHGLYFAAVFSFCGLVGGIAFSLFFSGGTYVVVGSFVGFMVSIWILALVASPIEHIWPEDWA